MAYPSKSATRRRKADPGVGPLLTTLGDATRRELIERLRAGPCTVAGLAQQVPVSRPAVSQHLKVLRDAGLVTETRAGTRHYFAVNPTAVETLRCHFEGLWQDVMLAFANYVEEAERAKKRTGHRKTD